MKPISQQSSSYSIAGSKTTMPVTTTSLNTAIIDTGAGSQMLWMKGAMLVSGVSLLFYLWTLVHFVQEEAQQHDGGMMKQDEEDLGEVYTVYACAVLLFAGMAVLWR